LREITACSPPEPTISVPRYETINHIAQWAGNELCRASQPPRSAGCSDQVYPRIRLGEASLTIQNQKRQRVIRIVAVSSQERAPQIALHRNQVKWWRTRMMLEPLCTTTTEIAQTVEDDYSAL
jgi:hypothetical protein